MNDIREALEKAYDGADEEVVEDETLEASGDSIEDLVSEDDEVVEEDVKLEADSTDKENLTVEDDEQELEAADEVEEEEIKAPQFWREDKKQVFNLLPNDLKQEVLRLDKEQQGYVTKLSQETSQLRNVVQGFNQVLEPYQDVIMQSGSTPEAYTKSLYYWDSYIRNNPAEAIQAIAENNGVDLHQLTTQQREVDPQVRQLEQKYASLEQSMLAEKQRQSQAQEQQLVMEVQAFESEVNAEGKALRPHIQDERVMQEMISQVPVLKQNYPQASNRQLLDEAYKRATLYYGLNEVAKPEKKVVSIKKAKNQAKKTASSLSGSGNSGASTKAGTTREALELSLQQLGM